MEPSPGSASAPRSSSWLGGPRCLGPATLDWLADYRFSGTIDGYREGELFFPGSPHAHRRGPVRRGADAGDASS